jgi:hypothetical protein
MLMRMRSPTAATSVAGCSVRETRAFAPSVLPIVAVVVAAVVVVAVIVAIAVVISAAFGHGSDRFGSIVRSICNTNTK